MFQVAFQANTTVLWTIGAEGGGNTGLGMMSGTSPSVIALGGGGYQTTFQANTGSLWSVGAAGWDDLTLGMMAGTSPAVAALSGGGHQIAFQANTGSLWSVGAAGGGDLQLGMMAGTSPSVAALADGGYVVAFQANTGSLWTLPGGETGLGMMAGSSPSVAALAGGGHVVAFQANTGNLWTVPGGDTGLGMMAGTSPSATALADGGYQIAFQANTGSLWTTGTVPGGDTGLGMMPRSSPEIAAVTASTPSVGEPAGLQTPANLGPPDDLGYHRLPDPQPEGLYAPQTGCRRGSLELVQAIHTVASRWSHMHPGSPVKVADLNGSSPPHVSHAHGVDVDIRVGHLTTDERIDLGRLFVDTGILKLILYSGGDLDTVRAEVNQHSGTNTVQHWPNHGTHYHVRLVDAFRGPLSRRCG